MKYIITEQQLDKVYDSYLDYLFEGLYEVFSEEYPNSRFWKIGDEVVMELEDWGRIWINVLIWNSFSDMFGLDYDEEQMIMKGWLEEHLNLGDVTPASAVVARRAFRWKNI